jgi:hypothetical protein
MPISGGHSARTRILRLSDMQFQAKNYTDAAAEYRQGLTVTQALHDKEAGNAKFLEHLSLAHGKLSDALISSNNLDQAMQEVALNISLSDDLVDEFARNVRWLLYREWARERGCVAGAAALPGRLRGISAIPTRASRQCGRANPAMSARLTTSPTRINGWVMRCAWPAMWRAPNSNIPMRWALRAMPSG